MVTPTPNLYSMHTHVEVVHIPVYLPSGDEDSKISLATWKQKRSTYAHLIIGGMVSFIGAIVALVTLAAG